jgi:hypothetical protein
MTDKLNLNILRLVHDDIVIITEPFAKTPFFKNGPVQLSFPSRSGGRNGFEGWIIPEIPEIVPVFDGKLIKTRLSESIFNLEILKEIGDLQPFTVGEFAAIIRDLLSKQPKGKDGLLLTNGHSNVFYVRLKDGRVVAVNACWYSNFHEWALYAYSLIALSWPVSTCVFFRG